MQAFLKGLQDTLDDPDAAYETSMQYVEGLEAGDAVQTEVLTRSLEFWQTERLGLADAAAWENMQQTLLDMGQLTAPLDLDAAFTNEFIP